MRSILAFILIAIAGPALAQDDLTELYTSLKPSVERQGHPQSFATGKTRTSTIFCNKDKDIHNLLQ